ncbi:hypothetical protein LCGC14_0943130 [marine sediment metagenome]|uniref:Photosynthesis system II assembly factor Ycf48/Hcf136-like domain-containing protein n=1 Tax=marine sediment metagenome TaxID=412755 RepID=A0A0F9P5I8_9ZZZZ
MADITTLYETVDAKDGTLVVKINGVLLNPVWRSQWRFDVGRVPSATIYVPNPTPAGVAYFADVTIDAGFNGVVQRVFTGIVLDVKNNELGCNIECIGRSWALDVTYQDILLVLTNITSEDAITDLLQNAGILDFTVNVPAWTIGTVAPQTLRFQSFGEAITKIAEVDGCRWYETPSGQVVVQVVPPVPSLGISREYFSMQLTALVESYPAGIVAGRPRLRRCQQQTRVRLTKNEVLVRGALVTEEIAPGVESSHDITALVQADSPYVLNADGSQAYNDLVFNNALIDTEEKGDEVADRLLVLHNRLWVFVSATIDGDPRMALIETHKIEDPSYSGVTGNWFVEGYNTTFGQQDFVTTMNLRGRGGLSNRDPVADFTWVVDREVIDDREYIVITVDGRTSFDPDGEIASYSWTDNQTPIVTGATAVVTVRADPGVVSEPWEVTLTVTDSEGATNSVTKTINVECGDDGVYIPAFYTALENNFSASQDGGQSWVDNAGSDVVSVAASPSVLGLAVYGTAGGAIYRTENFNQSAPSVVLAAVGSEIKHLWWDTNDSGRVWAVTEDARLYRSVDGGATWSLYVNLRTKLRPKRNWVANRIDTLSRAGSNVVRVFGGDSKGKLMIASDIGLTNNWSLAAIGGELQDDVGGSGPNDLIVFDAAFHSTGELAIILNSTTQTPSVYYTTDIFGDGSAWTRAAGDPAKPQGRWIEPDLEADKFVLAFNDTVIYTGDVTAGVMTVAAAAAALDGGDAPNHGLWIGRAVIGLAGVYVVSAEGAVDGTLYKTWDRFANIEKLRPATGFPAVPAGADAMMTAIGRGGCPEEILYAQQSDFGGISPSSYPRRVAELTALWTLQTDPAAASQRHVAFLQRVGAHLYRGDTLTTGFPGTLHPGQLQRSIDNGVTWADVGPVPVINGAGSWGVNTIIAGADGTLWSAYCTNPAAFLDPGMPPPQIWKSVDAGATWTLSFQDATLDGGIWRRFIAITAHPNDANVIAVLGDRFPGVLNTRVTVNGGSSWSRNVGSFIQSTGGLRQAVMMDNGRIVALMGTLGRASYSDDYGVSWVDVSDAYSAMCYDLIRAGDVVFSCGGAVSSDQIVKRSVDYGQTWVTVLDDSSMTVEVTRFQGLVYSPLTDKLYVCTNSDEALERVFALFDATKPTVGANLDVTFNLDDLFSDVGDLGQIGLHGISL